jgi:2-iminobutanoate/2-iminopropanoate deaminase
MATYLNHESRPGDQYGLSSGVAAGGYAFAAGMALDYATLRRTAAAASIADEVRICLDRIATTLGRGGFALSDVVKTTCWLSDEAHRAEFLVAYREVFAPGPYPARVTLVAGLAGDCRVEIDAVAMKA